jgi:signal transduction histidine kinase
MEVETTATRQRQTPSAVAVAGGGLVILIVADIIVGEQLFRVTRPALTADLAVLTAVGLALVAPPRSVPWAAVAASAASVGISLSVELSNTMTWSPLVGYGSWPGFAELAGLGLLTGWSVRSAGPRGALAAVVAFGLALAALVVWRTNGFHSDHLLLACAAAWAAVGAAGGYLRVLDARQREQASHVRQHERLAIARELHDVVAHHVTGIVVQAQAALLVAGEQPDAAMRALHTIERAGGEALGAMRAMVGALREESTADDLEPTASIDDLRAMATSGERGQLPVRVEVDDEAASLPGVIISSVHRIAREAVTNARRHALGATSVDINVSCNEGVVHLLVINDGVPAYRSPGGFGLRGMAERAAALGGDFDAGPLPRGGWRVTADLPTPMGGANRS